MINWKAAVVGAMCFSTVPTFSIVFSAILMASVFLPRKFFYFADGWIYDHYNRMIICFYHTLPRSRFVLYGDKDALRSKMENALCIANHQSSLDVVALDMLAAVQGNIGRTRYIIKDQMRFLPIVGGYLRSRGCIYVKRGKTKREGSFDEAYAVSQLNRLRTDQVPLWLIVYPEGTRFNPNKLEEIERSQAFARLNGLTVCDEVLTPRSKAVYLALRCLGSHLDAVYDFTIGYSATVPSATIKSNGAADSLQSSITETASNQTTTLQKQTHLSRKLRRLVAPGLFEFFVRPSDIHVHVSRIPMNEVPDASGGEEPVRRWLHNRFVEKEQLLKNFLYGDESQRGRFGSDGVQIRIPLSHTATSLAMWAGFNSLLLYSASGRYTYAAGGALATACSYAYVFATG